MNDEEVGGYMEILTECPFCGGLVPDDYVCIKCGQEILDERDEDKLVYACSICRYVLDDDVIECPNCKASFY